MKIETFSTLFSIAWGWQELPADNILLKNVAESEGLELDVRYGTDDRWIFGRWAFFKFELGGPIPENASIDFYANIMNIDEWIRKTSGF